MSLFNSEQFGKDTRFWIGQIIDDVQWKENIPGKKYEDPSEIPGWGYRYKVRIFGKHTENNLELNDVQVPWQDVIYPVTGGSGHAASFQTPNLRKYTFVCGFYLDGKDETHPVILGCFGNNDQTNLFFGKQPNGFIPASGFGGSGKDKEQVPANAIPPKPGNPIEGVVGPAHQNQEADIQSNKDGNEKSNLPTLEKCARSLDKSQIELARFILRVTEIQRRTKNWSYWTGAKGAQLASGVFRTNAFDIDVQRSAQYIAGGLKEFLNGIREFITKLIDLEISKVYKLFFPQEEKLIEKTHNGAIDLITCLFNKIIANLINIIGSILKALVGQVVNSSACFVENIVSGILGQLLGLITGTLSKILGPISSLIGGALDLTSDILGFVAQVLGFFLCDEQSACPESTEWSSWGGSSSRPVLDINNIFNKTKQVSETFKQVADIDNFDFKLDFKSIVNSAVNSCNVAPILCGPPTVEFYGGGGGGAKGNAIVSATGDILGVDIIMPGAGYSKPPRVNIVDACGKGNGSFAEAELDGDKVTKVKVKKPGFDYLPNFDGSRGGSGRVYVEKNQKLVKRKKRPKRKKPGGDTGTDILKYKVSFVDWDGRVLKTQVVKRGEDATPPKNPVKRGPYKFSRWKLISKNTTSRKNITFSNVKQNLVFKAVYSEFDAPFVPPTSVYVVTFIDWDGEVLKTEIVEQGENATPPKDPQREGYMFIGWDEKFINVTSDLTITADYSLSEDLDPEEEFFEVYDEDEDPEIIPGDPELEISGPFDDDKIIGDIGGISGGTFGTGDGTGTGTGDGSTSFGKYPVILKIEEIEIESTGVNYSPNDTIVVEPSNGAILEPVFGPFGSIVGVNIIDGGEGFVELPDVYIETKTGYNAELIPILGITRIGDISEDQYKIPFGEKIIQVVDCVGKP